MRNPKKFFEAAANAAKAIRMMELEGGNEGVKFFFNCFASFIPTPVPEAKSVDVVSIKQVPPVQVPKPVPPGTLLSEPQGQVMATGPARVVQKRRQPPPSGYFAAKLSEAAKKLGLESSVSPLTQLRNLLAQKGRGKEYWNKCRELVAEVFSMEKSLSAEDKGLLIGVMKKNLFFTGEREIKKFSSFCTKEEMIDLLLNEEDGLWQLVEMIRQELNFNPSSPFYLGAVMSICEAVGEEANELLTNCKYAVNRMKQKKFINSQNPLVKRVSEMSRNRQKSAIPDRKFADLKADRMQEEIAEAVESDSDVKVADEKPETLGSPEDDAAFKQQMLQMADEVREEISTEPKEAPGVATRPAKVLIDSELVSVN